jgi:hypothetical protein
MQASALADAQRDDDTLTVADLISAYEKGVEGTWLPSPSVTPGPALGNLPRDVLAFLGTRPEKREPCLPVPCS